MHVWQKNVITNALATTSPMLTTGVPARPWRRRKLATTENRMIPVSMMKQTALRREKNRFSRVMINFVFPRCALPGNTFHNICDSTYRVFSPRRSGPRPRSSVPQVHRSPDETVGEACG